MTSESISPARDGLTVTHADDWRYHGGVSDDRSSRLWSLSTDVRNAFGENLVESWGSTTDEVPLDQLVLSFLRSSASLPRWDEALSVTWQEGPVVYGFVSGTAAAAGELVESSSVIALRASPEGVSARQVVVTTFEDNHDRHLDALRRVTTVTTTLRAILDE